MSFAADLLAGHALAYARLIASAPGSGAADGSAPAAARLREGVELRVKALPWWAVLLASGAAFALRWLLPFIFLGKPRRFDRLGPEQADEVLRRLQLVSSPLVRGPFMALKSVVHAGCYADPKKLETATIPPGCSPPRTPGLPAQAARGERTEETALNETKISPPGCLPPHPSGQGRSGTRGGKRFDIIVAGSGAGGGAAAARLAAGGCRVLLLEKGPAASVPDDPMAAVYRYYTQCCFVASMGNAMIPIPTGTALGGTTVINSGTCLRTPADLLERWEKAGGGRFDKAGFSRFLDEAWERLKVKRAPEATLSGSSKIVLEGLARLGIKTGAPLDRSEDGCAGSGRCCFVCPRDAKMTSAKAFLSPLADDPNLTVATGAELVGVRAPRPGRGPVSVVVRDSGHPRGRTLECGELVLAAGALATPYFVRAFRLGPAWRLAGDGLSLHPAGKVFAHFAEPVRGWEGVPQGVGVEHPQDPAIRCEGVFTPRATSAVTMALEGSRLRWWLDRYDHVAAFGYMIRDEARGSVRYPLGPGLPLIRYDLSPADIRRLAAAARFVGEIFLAAGAERLLLPFNRPGNEVADLGRLEEETGRPVRPEQLYSMAFHPLGTCGMGRVVDEDLRLAPGIHVCDGSVVPESLGVNPQMTIYAFALRLADRLLGSRSAAGSACPGALP
ncbi:MAG: GMC family oxidoreductase [Elusimicrobia bacterium]|nr:GMC family oxidoreductase [Elusimicrobiota bacterium]